MDPNLKIKISRIIWIYFRLIGCDDAAISSRLMSDFTHAVWVMLVYAQLDALRNWFRGMGPPFKWLKCIGSKNLLLHFDFDNWIKIVQRVINHKSNKLSQIDQREAGWVSTNLRLQDHDFIRAGSETRIPGNTVPRRLDQARYSCAARPSSETSDTEKLGRTISRHVVV